jgi:hypothetical protein
MKRSLARAGVLAAAALVAVGLLSACAPSTASAGPKHHNGSGSGAIGQQPPSTVAPSATPTTVPTTPSTPTSTGLGPLPANALFRITATASQPNGAKVDLVQTVFVPSAPTAADTALLNSQCNFSGSPTWQSQYSGGLAYVTTTITATPRTGTAAWTNHDYDIGFGFGDGASAYSGNYRGVQAPCASGIITAPGNVHGAAGVLAASPVKGEFGWGIADSYYGFEGTGNNVNSPDFGGGTTVVDTCGVEISSAAIAAAPSLSKWKTQPFTKLNGCQYHP